MPQWLALQAGCTARFCEAPLAASLSLPPKVLLWQKSAAKRLTLPIKQSILAASSPTGGAPAQAFLVLRVN